MRTAKATDLLGALTSLVLTLEVLVGGTLVAMSEVEMGVTWDSHLFRPCWCVIYW